MQKPIKTKSTCLDHTESQKSSERLPSKSEKLKKLGLLNEPDEVLLWHQVVQVLLAS